VVVAESKLCKDLIGGSNSQLEQKTPCQNYLIVAFKTKDLNFIKLLIDDSSQLQIFIILLITDPHCDTLNYLLCRLKYFETVVYYYMTHVNTTSVCTTDLHARVFYMPCCNQMRPKWLEKSD